MNEKFIEFIYDKTLQRPKTLENSVFVLHSPQRIKIQPGEFRKIGMKLSVCLLELIVTACTILPSFSENGLRSENCQ